MRDLGVVILAAGQGKRMRSRRVKVLHPVAGRPMICYPVEAARTLSPRQVLVVVGHQGDWVREVVSPLGVSTVLQPEPRGTGDAVARALPALAPEVSHVLVLCGDTPLIQGSTLRRLAQEGREQKWGIRVLGAVLENPTGYGRLVRNPEGCLQAIVEEVDASEAVRAIREVNTGIYLFRREVLDRYLPQVHPENRQREWYLTDVVRLAVQDGVPVEVVFLVDARECIGVNSRVDLAQVEALMRTRINQAHMEAGVTLIDPQQTYIEAGVVLEPDVVLYPGVHLQGRTRVGSGAVIHAHCRIRDSEIGPEAVILDASVIEDSRVGARVQVGPFARLRPGTQVEEGARIGNFVELKNTRMGPGSKANHLSYLGDAEIGAGVNIGAGTITCNFDGWRKHPTRIEDGVFVGSDVQLVAPVTVGRGAFVAAGTTVTRDVPPEALAISRVPQENREGWARRRRERVQRDQTSSD